MEPGDMEFRTSLRIDEVLNALYWFRCTSTSSFWLRSAGAEHATAQQYGGDLAVSLTKVCPISNAAEREFTHER